MKKYLLLLNLTTLIISCKAPETILDNETLHIKLEALNSKKIASTITQKKLKTSLYQFSSDNMEGRETGEPGQKKAAEYLKNAYKKLGIPSPKGIDYYQYIPKAYFNGQSANDSENVMAFLEGTEIPEEVVIISAHYDHIGVNGTGEVFNGADDDGSGTMAILQMAEAFAKAKKKKQGPKRSILFLHVTAEEKGLYGSRFYTENPILPLTNTIADLNIDMIGRVDNKHLENPNYIYLIGSDRLSNELHWINEAVNTKYSHLNFDYTFNKKNDPNRFYYRSDHYNFAKHNIPVIFYFNGVHKDYHKTTDTADKINYSLLELRTKLIFHTAWELANRKNRITLSKKK